MGTWVGLENRSRVNPLDPTTRSIFYYSRTVNMSREWPVFMSLSISPSRKKTRHGITNIQRKALRDWYNDDSKGKVTQNDCRMWWKREYNYVPGNASISELLSFKYAYLDDKEEASSIKREVIFKWSELEDALFEWEQRDE